MALLAIGEKSVLRIWINFTKAVFGKMTKPGSWKKAVKYGDRHTEYRCCVSWTPPRLVHVEAFVTRKHIKLKVILTCFVNKTIKVNCIHSGVAYPYNWAYYQWLISFRLLLGLPLWYTSLASHFVPLQGSHRLSITVALNFMLNNKMCVGVISSISTSRRGLYSFWKSEWILHCAM